MTSSDYENMFDLPEAMRGGHAEAFSAHIKSIAVQDGDLIKIPNPGVTLIVGGNNAGKSTLLKQMHGRLTAGWSESVVSNPPVLSQQNLALSGTLADVVAWLGESSRANDGSFHRNATSVHPSIINLAWNNRESGKLDRLGQAISLAPDARTRFNATVPAARRPDIAGPPSTALHYFEDNPELMAELDGYSRDIFGIGLTLDPLSGMLLIRFGTTGVEAPPVDSVTVEYREAISRLTPLDRQGDGVASTLGLLIPLLAGRNPVSFVDEPEAYLHPPQAYKLGQTVATIAQRYDCQIIVATHDREFVAGVLSSRNTEQTVVRMERSGETSRAYPVDPDSLRDIWSSALLRHSNVLNGLFHRAVVVAEDERDCVFYAAALEAAGPLPGNLLPSDILFVSAHGKGGVPEMASILASAHVPVVAAVDLDVLREEAALQKMVMALGGKWDPQMGKDLKAATAEFRTARKPLSHEQVLGSIQAVLAKDPQATYNSVSRKAVSLALSVDDPWESVKTYGLAAFHGDRPATDRLVTRLAAEGVVVVPVGRLERFAPSLGVAKGKNWLPAALDANAHLGDTAQSYALDLARAIAMVEAKVPHNVTN